MARPEDLVARIAERAPTREESTRTTFRLTPLAAAALEWLTAHLRTTQKEVLAGLPDVVDDLRETGLWARLDAALTAPPGAAPGAAPRAAPRAQAVPPPAPAMHRRPSFPEASEALPDAAFDAALDPVPRVARALLETQRADEEEDATRSTFVLTRPSLERLNAQSEALGVARDEVVSRALVALRAAVEVREGNRTARLRGLAKTVSRLAWLARDAASEAVALPPSDPVRLELERAATAAREAEAALERALRSPPPGGA